MENEITITETLKRWDEGTLDVKALWYDWFCKTDSLVNKGHRLLQKLKVISKSKKFDNDKTYVFFRNGCPCEGRLYDEFKICDIETGNVLYCIVPSSGFTSNRGNAELWGRENKFEKPIIDGSWREVKAWFLS